MARWSPQGPLMSDNVWLLPFWDVEEWTERIGGSMSGEIIAILAVGVALVLSAGRLRKIAIQTVRNGRIGILGCLFGECSGIFMGTAFAQEGGSAFPMSG